MQSKAVLNWDVDKYNTVLLEGLRSCNINLLNISNQAETITTELKKAAKSAVPSNPIKPKGPKWKASPTVKNIWKHVKCYTQNGKLLANQ